MTKPNFNSKTKFEAIFVKTDKLSNTVSKKTGSHWFSQTGPLEAESWFFTKVTILDFDEMKKFYEENIFKIRT